MTVHTLADDALAEIGMLVRRHRAGTLSQSEFYAIVWRLAPMLARPETDPAGLVSRDLDTLVAKAEADDLSPDQFRALADRMHARVKAVREARMAPAARRSRFAVIDGDRPHTPHH